MLSRLIATGLLVAAATAHAVPPAVRLAWQNGSATAAVERVGTRSADVLSASLRTPLGSVWKLFVYSYLAANNLAEPPYRCVVTERRADDDYCCEPGASIGRDEALASSCGPYFDPARLGISAREWARFWQAHDAPVWVRQLQALRPETELPVGDLLRALGQVPPAARVAARRALLPVDLREEAVLDALGSGPRFKTWSWHVGSERAGGAAGWLADATPFWFQAPGTSRSALRANAGWIASQWSAHGLASPVPDAAVRDAESCVEVAFFQRYPILSVHGRDGRPTTPGPMRGRQVIKFRSGSALEIDATPALQLANGAGGPTISGRLPLEDYVARVVDREGQGREPAAARALAIAARSYVLQNAGIGEACRLIADDSRSQRVGPNPPSAAARAAAAFTEGVIVLGVPVRYHSDRASPGVMSWRGAVEAGRAGAGFEQILRTAYPGGTLGGVQAVSECEPLPAAQAWLHERQQRWRQLLRTEPGFAPPDGGPQVCQLQLGAPNSDQRRMLIRVREWQSREGRVTLIHEYLHLAFRNHPHGQDEAFVERLAQQLADL